HLVEQRPGLHGDHEQQHQRREYIDPALVFRADIGPDQIDREMAAAVAGGGDAPEDQDAEQHAPDIERVGNRIIQRVAQDHRNKNVERHDADESRRDPFDGVDETVHGGAVHVGSGRNAVTGNSMAAGIPAASLIERQAVYCASALYLVNAARSSAIAASGSAPVLRTLSAQVLTSGSDAF